MSRAHTEDRGEHPDFDFVGGETDDMYALDPSTLDPKLHYRFCHPRNLGRRRQQGYVPVSRSGSGIKFLYDHLLVMENTPDDLIHRGESFLMCCRKDVYREREKRKQQITKERISAPANRFKQKARKHDVDTVSGRQRGEPKGEDE